MRFVADAGVLYPRLVAMIDRHPSSLEARQSKEPLAKDKDVNPSRWQDASPIGQFQAPKGYAPPPAGHWNTYTISGEPRCHRLHDRDGAPAPPRLG